LRITGIDPGRVLEESSKPRGTFEVTSEVTSEVGGTFEVTSEVTSEVGGPLR
jgi:hypothetical protein